APWLPKLDVGALHVGRLDAPLEGPEGLLQELEDVPPGRGQPSRRDDERPGEGRSRALLESHWTRQRDLLRRTDSIRSQLELHLPFGVGQGITQPLAGATDPAPLPRGAFAHEAHARDERR